MFRAMLRPDGSETRRGEAAVQWSQRVAAGVRAQHRAGLMGTRRSGVESGRGSESNRGCSCGARLPGLLGGVTAIAEVVVEIPIGGRAIIAIDVSAAAAM